MFVCICVHLYTYVYVYHCTPDIETLTSQVFVQWLLCVRYILGGEENTSKGLRFGDPCVQIVVF